ncbi:MAG: YdcH family protein [bacterium]
MNSADPSQLRHLLSDLILEHRALDDLIALALENPVSAETLKLQRMKKRKLQLKDEIARLESLLIPDLDA